jgi:hypothetical protein
MADTRNPIEIPSPQVAEHEAKRQLARDIYGGTDSMIAAGQTWLPKHPGESDTNYKIRLNSCILTNFLAQAVDKQTGKIFAKPIVLKENALADIVAICENIDRQGRNLDSFIMDVVKCAFVDGIGYILCDYPKIEGALTLADEKQLGARPYAINIKAEDILEIASEMINGVQTVTRIRFEEEYYKPLESGYGYEEIEQIRVLKRNPDATISFELWQEFEAANGTTEWRMIEEGLTTFKRIYIVPIYTNRTCFMQGLPPNQSIAELNLRHWRSTSEQINALSFQRFAMLSAVGVQDEDKIAIGPSKLLRSLNPDAKFGYIEPTGKGVEMGRLDLESIEKAIETASANLRIERGGQVTATAAAIDSTDSNAGLKAIALGIQDSIEQMFMYFAEMLGYGADAGGEVEVNTDFGERKGTDSGLQELTKGRAIGDVSRSQWLESMIWRGELPPDFDKDLNQEELDGEAPAMSMIDITPRQKQKTITRNADGSMTMTEA